MRILAFTQQTDERSSPFTIHDIVTMPQLVYNGNLECLIICVPLFSLELRKQVYFAKAVKNSASYFFQPMSINKGQRRIIRLRVRT